MTHRLIALCSIENRRLCRRNALFSRSFPASEILLAEPSCALCCRVPETVVEYQKEVLRDGSIRKFSFETGAE